MSLTTHPCGQFAVEKFPHSYVSHMCPTVGGPLRRPKHSAHVVLSPFTTPHASVQVELSPFCTPPVLRARSVFPACHRSHRLSHEMLSSSSEPPHVSTRVPRARGQLGVDQSPETDDPFLDLLLFFGASWVHFHFDFTLSLRCRSFQRFFPFKPPGTAA